MSAKQAKTPRVRPAMSDAQKKLLSRRQKEYIANDPRWNEHRAKLSKAMTEYTSSDPRFPEHCREFSERKRFKLFDEEISAAKELLGRGRNLEYVSETLCMSEDILRRELRSLGIDPKPASPKKRAKRGRGPWRSFEPAEMATVRLDR